MASPAQITANRANAEHSTGPTSAHGKKRSSRNSTRHGLTARDLYIPEELHSEFEALREDLKYELQPTTPIETVLFNQVLSATWKLFRCDRAEAQLDALVSAPGLEPMLDPALEPQLRTIERARAQANKSLHKAIIELRRVQTENQYRRVQMPEKAGFRHKGMGLADWQTIRARIRAEGLTPCPDEESQATPDPEQPAAAAPIAFDPVPADLTGALDYLIANPDVDPMSVPDIANYFARKRANRESSFNETNPISNPEASI
jgi:hypothetical protein